MDSKAKIEYIDKENLYITMKSGDKMTQMRILNAGMSVWIDLSGKKDKVTGIIKTRIGFDGTGELVWEAKVPFKTFYKETIRKTWPKLLVSALHKRIEKTEYAIFNR